MKNKILKLIKTIKDDKYLLKAVIIGVLIMSPSFFEINQPQKTDNLTLSEIMDQPLQPSLERIGYLNFFKK